MSYQVIARKWRPRDFNELIGQEHVSQTLLNALRNDRLHHALLFTGPRGTGKTSSARILAKALRCPNAQDFLPCHTCPECDEIASGRSVNVIEIDGASNNGVDAIRELRDTVGYMPSSGRIKLYIIDEVHMLSTSAFNALLKTLEEPPGHVIFILATTEVHKIPETVLSRVQRFDFRCIPLRLIAEHLKTICQKEGVAFEDEALWTIARQGAGSMRDSQSFLDQAVTFAGGKLTLTKVVEVLGLTDRRMLTETLAGLVKRDTAAVVNVIERLFYAGYDPKLYMQDLLEELRHMLLVKIVSDNPARVVDLPDGEIQKLVELGRELSQEDIHLLFDMALKGAHDIPKSQDPKVVLEMVLLRMASAPRIQNLLNLMPGTAGVVNPMGSESPARPSATPPAATPSPAVVAQPAVASNLSASASPTEASLPAPAPAAAPISVLAAAPTGAPAAAWAELVRKVTGINSIIGAQLENCFLYEIKGKSITLGVSPKMKFLIDKLSDAEFKKKLLNYITTFWGPGYQLEVIAAEPSATIAQTPKAMASQQQDEERLRVRRQVEEHPLIKSAQSVFKTEIRSIKENKT